MCRYLTSGSEPRSGFNLSDATISGKSKMVASKLHIRSDCKQDSNEIPMAIPMFSGSSYPIIVVMLDDQTGSNRK